MTLICAWGGFPTANGQVALINATGMSILTTDKRMETAKRALAAVCSAEANEAVAK